MKVLFLSGRSSIHTIRWVNALSQAGIDIMLATQHESLEAVAPTVRVYRLPFSGPFGYFRNVPTVRKVLAEEKPDLINTHYASGYGTTARLSGFEPTLLSVWGSDVYDFPGKSALHRWWLRGNLMAATRVASTSHAMAEQTRQIAPALGEISVTPFGVETDRFLPAPERTSSPDRPIVIGTVKTLGEAYGIDTLISSFALLLRMLSHNVPQLAKRLQLRIVGDGPQKDALERQVLSAGIQTHTHFYSRIPHDQVPAALRELDIYAALSRQESFGVAIIEASSCCLPVVVSDAGGLPEVVADGDTGFVVPRENPQAAADALYKLVLDADLRRRMGQAGRRRVISLYEWKDNVRQMIDLFEKVVGESGNSTSK